MPFDIEDYLNSLPLDTNCIDVSYKGLTYLPDLSRFKKLKRLYCNDNLITVLPKLNDTIEVIDCKNNQLTELPELNNKLIILICRNNKLTWLPPLNNNLHHLDCSINRLTELPTLNNKLTQLLCSNNKLKFLPPLTNDLVLIDCSNNKLTELPQLNHNLSQLDCYQNKLTYLPPLNNNLKVLSCYNNKFYNNTKYFNIIQTLRKFRNTYYLLKFKKHFKRWLWEKVREPKIMAKFHPSHLTNLEETDDLEVFLDNWIKNDCINK